MSQGPGRQVFIHTDPSWRLRAAADATRLDGLTLLVPNVAAGRHLRSALGDHLPARALSQLAREHLRSAGWRPLRPAEREGFLRRALEGVGFHYLGPLLGRPSTWTALSRLLGELLRADLEPAAARAVACGEREQEVAGALSAYVAACWQERRFDLSGTEYFARRASAPAPLLAVVHGFTHLDAAQIAFLSTLLAPGSVVTLPDPDLQRVPETRRTLGALEACGFSAQRPAGALLPSPAPRPLVYAAPDVESEVRSALRQVRAWLNEGLKAADLAVVVRDEATYLPVLLEVAREYGVTLTGRQQLPLAQTGVGAFALSWLDAAGSGWRFPQTKTLLTHPLCGLLPDGLGTARQLSARCPSGLSEWSSERNGDLGWLDLGDPCSLAEGARTLERLLLDAGVLARCGQDQALNVHTVALAEVLRGAARDDTQRPRGEVLSLLRHLVTTQTVPLLLGRGGVRVVNPLALLGRHFARAWVLGLADGCYPPRVSDSPLLGSAVRARWAQGGTLVPDAATSAAVEETVFSAAVLGCAPQLGLSRPLRTAKGQAQAASALLTRQGPLPPWAGDVPLASAAEALLTEALMQGSLNGPLLNGAGQEGLTSALREAARIERDRDAGTLSAHHGLIGEDLWDEERRWSPSQLHDVGACRFRWFGRKLLNLAEEVDPDAGEDRRVTGTLLHAALEGALRGWTPEDEEEALLARAETALDRAAVKERQEGRFFPGPLFGVERQEWLESVGRAIRSPDFLPPGWVPEGLEDRLSTELQVGDAIFRLGGIVDRVDRTPEGLMVTDYKAGKYISHVQPDGGDGQNSAAKLSLEIQLPLYMRALGAAGGRYLSVEGAEVIGTAGRLNTKRAYDAAAHEQALDAFLLGVKRDLSGGAVIPRPDIKAEACGFCTVSAVCRYRGGVQVEA